MGYDTKDLPEKAGKSMGKCNATLALRVDGIRECGKKGKVMVELTSRKPSGKDDIGAYEPNESTARLCMSAEEAKHYPVGSMVALHCLPAGKPKKETDEDRLGRIAKETMEEDDDEEA